MKKLLLAAITVTAMAFSSCGSDNASCSDKGKCANDTAPTADSIASCQSTLAGACGGQYQAVMNCVKSSEKCDSSGDMDLTALLTSCGTQVTNYTACCTSNPTACPTN
jgi:hypothetical protein